MKSIIGRICLLLFSLLGSVQSMAEAMIEFPVTEKLKSLSAEEIKALSAQPIRYLGSRLSSIISNGGAIGFQKHANLWAESAELSEAAESLRRQPYSSSYTEKLNAIAKIEVASTKVIDNQIAELEKSISGKQSFIQGKSNEMGGYSRGQGPRFDLADGARYFGIQPEMKEQVIKDLHKMHRADLTAKYGSFRGRLSDALSELKSEIDALKALKERRMDAIESLIVDHAHFNFQKPDPKGLSSVEKQAKPFFLWLGQQAKSLQANASANVDIARKQLGKNLRALPGFAVLLSVLALDLSASTQGFMDFTNGVGYVSKQAWSGDFGAATRPREETERLKRVTTTSQSAAAK